MAFLPAATIAAICLVAPAISVLWKLCLFGCPQAPFGVRFFLFPPDGRRIVAAFNETKKGRHRCRPASGGEERDPTLIAVFVLLASSYSCAPAGVAGVPA